MSNGVSFVLQQLIRALSGSASRARNAYYKSLGVEINGYAWLRKIEIPRNFSDILLANRVALDTGVTLLCTGMHSGKKKIIIGENTYINRFTFIDASNEIRIGRNVGIGPRCYITDHDHGTASREPIMAQPLLSGDATTICDNVWLGAHVIVLRGVTIGANTVVAAGSIVVRDLPSDVIAEGRPARAVKKRR
jgi:acetyltransferase-like isoleucine patch superfamily enzyme